MPSLTKVSIISLLFHREANEAFVDGELDLALRCYNEAIDVDDSQVKFYVKRAACLIKLAKYTGVILLHGWCDVTGGVLRCSSRTGIDAIMDTKTALQLDPNCLLALLRQGSVHWHGGVLSFSVSFFLAFVLTFSSRRDASFALDDYRSALSAYVKAKEVDGDNTQAKTGIAKCCAKLGISERYSAQRPERSLSSRVAVSLLTRGIRGELTCVSLFSSEGMKPATLAPAAKIQDSGSAALRIKHDWYQVIRRLPSSPLTHRSTPPISSCCCPPVFPHTQDGRCCSREYYD